MALLAAAFSLGVLFGGGGGGLSLPQPPWPRWVTAEELEVRIAVRRETGHGGGEAFFGEDDSSSLASPKMVP